jgi:putative thymidine phosphorylase
VVSICAAAGLTMPKTSSRAITSAAGTADVIETISNVEFDLKDLKSIVNKTGAVLAWGGSLNLSPSDDKIIQVEKLLNLDVPGQMIASILSKKIAAGSKYILIDIPYGKGAKVETYKGAKKLGKMFIEYSKPFGVKLDVIYTDGRQPVGHGIGPVLEMLDVIKVLENAPEAPRDLRRKAICLSAELMKLAGIKHSRRRAIDILESGQAFLKFKEIINAQNKNKLFEKKIGELRVGRFSKGVYAQKSGSIVSIDNNGINDICRILGTPETKSAGVYLHKGLGRVSRGEEFMTLYSESENKLDEAIKYLQAESPVVIK